MLLTGASIARRIMIRDQSGRPGGPPLCPVVMALESSSVSNDELLVRDATLELVRRRWGDRGRARIVEEMGTHFGQSRVDIAVVNGSLRGFEIKSARDRLTRLPHQVSAFNEVFDYMTLVVASFHLDASVRLVPEWWGVIEAVPREDGVHLRSIRREAKNPEQSPRAIACLLWREELAAALDERGLLDGFRSASRLVLVDRLVESLSTRVLAAEVRARLKERQGWRADRVPPQGDERSRLGRRSSGFLARRTRMPHPQGTGPLG